ncbi:MAG TPA: CHRD domain-containing protein [Gemmatimonadaceae bacterium]|nr:CHRD domain-containing protein [Gemmatimonadaceae bacterium]
MRPSFRLFAALAAVGAIVAACDDTESTEPAPLVWTATLAAANEVATTPVVSSGSGTATFTLEGTTLRYAIDVANLTTTPTASHIHLAASGVNGPIIINFFPAGTTVPTALTNATFASGSIDLSLGNVATQANTTISGDSLRKLLDGSQVYVNVHTSRFAGGEIRGQIVRR